MFIILILVALEIPPVLPSVADLRKRALLAVCGEGPSVA